MRIWEWWLDNGGMLDIFEILTSKCCYKPSWPGLLRCKTWPVITGRIVGSMFNQTIHELKSCVIHVEFRGYAVPDQVKCRHRYECSLLGTLYTTLYTWSLFMGLPPPREAGVNIMVLVVLVLQRISRVRFIRTVLFSMLTMVVILLFCGILGSLIFKISLYFDLSLPLILVWCFFSNA